MKKNNKKGFTLIEILISLSIITIVVISFFSFINSGIKFNAKNEKDIKALNIAQSEIENLREQIKSSKESELEELEYITLNDKSIKVDEQVEDKSDGYFNREISLNKSLDVYTVYVKVTPINNFFGKREVELITKVFGN